MNTNFLIKSEGRYFSGRVYCGQRHDSRPARDVYESRWEDDKQHAEVFSVSRWESPSNAVSVLRLNTKDFPARIEWEWIN